jgi:hypothetical protein
MTGSSSCDLYHDITNCLFRRSQFRDKPVRECSEFTSNLLTHKKCLCSCWKTRKLFTSSRLARICSSGFVNFKFSNKSKGHFVEERCNVSTAFRTATTNLEVKTKLFCFQIANPSTTSFLSQREMSLMSDSARAIISLMYCFYISRIVK